MDMLSIQPCLDVPNRISHRTTITYSLTDVVTFYFCFILNVYVDEDIKVQLCKKNDCIIFAKVKFLSILQIQLNANTALWLSEFVLLSFFLSHFLSDTHTHTHVLFNFVNRVPVAAIVVVEWSEYTITI